MEKTAPTSPSSQANQFAKQCLAEALVRLMEERELDDISVTDICKAAGFSRMAYYRNFQSKRDILRQYMRLLADEFRREALEKYPNLSSRSYEIILFGLEYFQDYRMFAERLIQANLTSILQDGMNYYFETYLAGSESGLDRHYAMHYYSGALVNVYTFWIARGMSEPPEYVAKIIHGIVKKKPSGSGA